MNVKTQSDHQANVEVEQKPESAWSFVRFLAIVVTVVLVFRIFLFSPFSIPSESMLPKLWNGDYLLASKWSYGFSNNSLPLGIEIAEGRLFASEPELGDIVIFKHPIDGTDYIKRVIALPGDSIALVDGQIMLNGELIERVPMDDFEIPISVNTTCAWGGEETTNAAGEAVCRYTQYRETLPNGVSYEVLDFGNMPSDSYPPKIIPEGHMFVMGDNRDNSRDSRFEARSGDAVGIVPQDNLVGEATVLMWSTDGGSEWIRPWTWFSSARWSRIGNGL